MGSLVSEEETRKRGFRKMISMKFKIAIQAVVLTLLACSAFAAITNTKHDLSFFTTAWPASPSYRTDEVQVCIFCHTPHGGSLTGPLWNKPTPGAGTFTMYSNPANAFKVEMNSVVTVNDESLLCLSCHDGSIGVNNLLNFGQAEARPNVLENPGVEVSITGSPGANPRIGALTSSDPNGTGHLEDDHPISLNYVTAVSNDTRGELRPIGSVDSRIKFFGGNRLECASCHDVHDNSIPPFLVMSNSGSALCLSCHDK